MLDMSEKDNSPGMKLLFVGGFGRRVRGAA